VTWLRSARLDGYFRLGFKADLLLDELMAQLPELFYRAQYADEDVRNFLAVIKQPALQDDAFR